MTAPLRRFDVSRFRKTPNWISVVGITGFDRIRDSAEYDEYVARILSISNEMAGTSKFKRFDPKPFKWKEMKRN